MISTSKIHADDEKIHDFTIAVDRERVEDLKNRVKLGKQRLQKQLEDTDFEFGFSANYLKNLTEAWLKYDWKQHETEIEGLLIHFVRTNYPSKNNEKKIPILLIHGYPSSFWDFYKVIPILANPGRFGFDFGSKGSIVFDVVVPSIPGFGFSEKPQKKGFGFIECARSYAKLMSRLGHKKFFVFGSGELGVETATALTLLAPEAVQGLQVVNPWISPFQDAQIFVKSLISSFVPSLYLGENEKPVRIADYLDKFSYFWTMKSRPDSLSVAVNDSPLGLAAWLLDRFALGVKENFAKHPQGWLQNSFTVDELLTEVHLYWFTETFPHAARFFKNSYGHPLFEVTIRAPVNTSTAIITLPASSISSPRHLLDHCFRNIVRYTVGNKEGDFAPLRDHRLVAEEIFAFVEEIVG
ncbi:hypothetical protein L596_009589 [Steinernema carpocapsae]|uniref:Epoxide hydrolase n=1 Tax=Steinernema carpocapsae TaxID=34508 RepID=A0A4V6A6P3_STECR|nr:hypothetical protein L596_009589 [Steinernema carpocapsae]